MMETIMQSEILTGIRDALYHFAGNCNDYSAAYNRYTKQEYVILQKSEKSYKRCKALINIIKGDFGEEVIYMCTSIEKAKEEILKCFNNIFKYISWLNHIDETEKVYHFYRLYYHQSMNH